MYRYTLAPRIRKRILQIRKAPFRYHREYEYVRELLNRRFGENQYQAQTAFQRHAVDLVFYSPKRLKEVPVNGLLMPVDLFHEEEV